MTLNLKFERVLLQISIFVCGFVPVLAGGVGIIYGSAMLDTQTDINMDSHYRYLSALLFGIGLMFWSCIFRPETKELQVRVLTIVVFLGGLARLVTAITYGFPSLSMTLAIGMELVVTPILYFWVRRIASLSA